MALIRRAALVRQARSVFAVYELLLAADRDAVPACHPLHYFQMATEKVAKAAFEALGIVTDRFSHVAFSQVPYHLAGRDVARAPGYPRFDAYRTFLARAAPLFRLTDELNPAVGLQVPGGGAQDGPNVEYPWEARDNAGAVTWVTPADHHFKLFGQMLRGGDAARMVEFVRRLLDRFDAVFP